MIFENKVPDSVEMIACVVVLLALVDVPLVSRDQ